MPQSALDNVKVDFCVPLSKMGALLQSLVSKPPPKTKGPPDDIALEAQIAERVISDVAAADSLGKQVPYNCPNCGGVLWQMSKSKVDRYRCHTGHAFTAASLEASQLERIEETLWICLRMLEERKNLLTTTAHREEKMGFRRHAATQRERADETKIHIDRIRDILLTSTKAMLAGIHPKH